jgi:hypothetical protein
VHVRVWVCAHNRRTLECKFAADVAGTIQTVLAAAEIGSLDDVVDVLDEARLVNRPLPFLLQGWS